MRSLNYICLLLLTGTLLTPIATAQAKAKAKKGVYRHVVLFGFNEDISDEQIKEVEDAFGKLPSQINTIIDFEFGTNVSPENINDGLTHCFFVTFKNKAGLEVYLPHPAHKKFVELVKGKLAKVVVVDYISK